MPRELKLDPLTGKPWLYKPRKAKKHGPSREKPGLVALNSQTYFGTPSKYDQTKANMIIGAIAEGLLISDAASRAGVGDRSLWQWMDDIPDFRALVNHAKAMGAHRLVAMAERELKSATKETIPVARELASHYRWRASRQNPAEYGDHSKMLIAAAMVPQSKLSEQAPEWVKNMLGMSEERAAATEPKDVTPKDAGNEDREEKE